MAGLTDYTATALLNDATGALPYASAGVSRYLGLFTTAPTSDSGVTGATEVSGGSYARAQIAGVITVNGTTSTASPTLHVASVPAWLAALGTVANPGYGVNVYDLTTSTFLGTVSTCTSGGTTITLQANSLGAVGATDNLQFSAFPQASNSSGSEPAVTAASVANGAAVNFPLSTGAWGTVSSFGIFDAASSGNNRWWDYLGAYKWSPFTCTSASPGVLTVTDQSFSGITNAVVSAKIGGTLPATGGSWAGLLTVAGVSGSTFNLGVNTTGTGDGLVRPVATQVIANNTTTTFASGQLTLAAA